MNRSSLPIFSLLCLVMLALPLVLAGVALVSATRATRVTSDEHIELDERIEIEE